MGIISCMKSQEYRVKRVVKGNVGLAVSGVAPHRHSTKLGKSSITISETKAFNNERNVGPARVSLEYPS